MIDPYDRAQPDTPLPRLRNGINIGKKGSKIMEQMHFTLRYVCQELGISPKTVRKYIDEGLVEPSDFLSGQPLFDQTAFERLAKIRRLRRDLGINIAGIDIILRLLERVEELNEEIGRLKDLAATTNRVSIRTSGGVFDQYPAPTCIIGGEICKIEVIEE